MVKGMDSKRLLDALKKVDKSVKETSEQVHNAINLVSLYGRELSTASVEITAQRAFETAKCAIDALDIANGAIDFNNCFEPEQIPKREEAENDFTQKTKVYFDESLQQVRCIFRTPPMTKRRATANRFSEIFCADLREKVSIAVPPKMKRLDDAYVVFINHYARRPELKQPYYDNDNLAIKAILDSVVPFVCVDDAALYCGNLYLCQAGDEDFCELDILPKENFRLWLLSRTDLEFSRQIVNL